MRYLLDTTVLIDFVNARPTALALVHQLFSEPNDLLTCDIVVTEALSAGADDQLAAVRALVDALEFVSTHPIAAQWAAESRRRLRRTSPRQLGDAIIAGVAWFNDATVVTRNPGDFEVQGVPVLAYG